MASITAPDYKEANGPIVFLAGPIQGAEDWQRTAIELLTRTNPAVNVASSRGDYSNRKFDYDAQVDWETHYLKEAAKTGSILFWLAKEKEHICDRAFAQTTRFELAEWVTKYGCDKNLRLSIGIEPGFSGERYLRRRIGQDHPELQIYSKLEDVCTAAVGKL
ncbi:Nucleoside 2-deoxyribosyltransferase like protein [uncultured archaeon]|nr:Nucleoside 2-deoxyribosyltransferase like protein [uncultured archaeon]